jgi:hypothetical protein
MTLFLLIFYKDLHNIPIFWYPAYTLPPCSLVLYHSLELELTKLLLLKHLFAEMLAKYWWKQPLCILYITSIMPARCCVTTIARHFLLLFLFIYLIYIAYMPKGCYGFTFCLSFVLLRAFLLIITFNSSFS